MVYIVPRVNPNGVRFVRHVNERDADLGWIAPLANVGVRITRINELILLDDVFSAVVFEVLDIQHLGVWVVVYPGNGRVHWIGHVHNVHIVPTSEVSVRFPVRCGGHLHFGVSGRGQGVEIEKFHVVRSEFVLTGIFVVVSLFLDQWVTGFHGRVFLNGLLNIVTVTKNQHGYGGKKKNRKDTKKEFFTAHNCLTLPIRLVFMIWGLRINHAKWGVCRNDRLASSGDVAGPSRRSSRTKNADGHPHRRWSRRRKRHGCSLCSRQLGLVPHGRQHQQHHHGGAN